MVFDSGGVNLEERFSQALLMSNERRISDVESRLTSEGIL